MDNHLQKVFTRKSEVSKLKTFCKLNGIKNYSKYNKKELILRISKHIISLEKAVKNPESHKRGESPIVESRGESPIVESRGESPIVELCELGEQSSVDKFNSLDLNEKEMAISFIENLREASLSKINSLLFEPFLSCISDQLKIFKFKKQIKEITSKFKEYFFFSQKKYSLSLLFFDGEDILSSFSFSKTVLFLKFSDNPAIKNTHKNFYGSIKSFNIIVYYITKFENNTIEVESQIIETFNADYTIDTILKLFNGDKIILDAFHIHLENGFPPDFILKNFTRSSLFLKIQGYRYFKKFIDIFDVAESVNDKYLRNMSNEKVIKILKELIFTDFNLEKTKNLLTAFSLILPKNAKYYPLDDIELYHTDKIFALSRQKDKILSLYKSGNFEALSDILPGRFGEFNFYQFREIKKIEETINYLSSTIEEEDLQKNLLHSGRENFSSLPLLMMREVVYLNTLKIFNQK